MKLQDAKDRVLDFVEDVAEDRTKLAFACALAGFILAAVVL